MVVNENVHEEGAGSKEKQEQLRVPESYLELHTRTF
jgi:hypothetical protein